MRGPRGFTLIELLLVIGLVTMVAGTIVAIFAGGSRVWERFQQGGVREQWTLVALEQMSRELRACRPSSAVSFVGAYDEVSCLRTVPLEGSEDPALRELARNGFYFDDRHDRICRSRQRYRGLRDRRLRDSCEPVAEGISRLRFEFFGAETAGGEPRWVTTWRRPVLPLAVKIELGYAGDEARETIVRSRIVHLPLAHPVAADEESSE